MMPMPMTEAHLHQLKRSYRPKSLGYRITVIGSFTIVVVYIYWLNWSINSSTFVESKKSALGHIIRPQLLREPANFSVLSTSGPEVVNQTTRKLLEQIRHNWLQWPSPHSPKVNLSATYKTSKQIRALRDVVLKLSMNKTGGFFVETGPTDGEHLSTTLLLEIKKKWRGVVIEPDPKFFRILNKKRRKSWLINACISSTTQQETVTRVRRRSLQQLTPGLRPLQQLTPGLRPLQQLTPGLRVKSLQNSTRKNITKATILKEHGYRARCFPFLSIIAAILSEPYQVDYLSLTRENAKLKILESIPWDVVHINIISIENGSGRRRMLRKFLERNKYVAVTEKMDPESTAEDLVMVHRNYWKAHQDYLTNFFKSP